MTDQNSGPPPSKDSTPGLVSRLRSIRFPERALLAALLLLGTSILVFLGVADWVQDGNSQRFDEFVLRSMRKPDNPSVLVGPAWGTEAARDVTALGSAAVVVLVSGGVLGYLLLSREWRSAILVLVCVVGGVLASFSLKQLFARARPTIVPHLDHVTSYSFPSGHSMLSAVTYLTLGAILARSTRDRTLKLYYLGLATVLVFLIGLSRMLLGVHYPSDVLAGWCVGLGWALLCSVVMRSLQHRGKVEPPTDPHRPPTS